MRQTEWKYYLNSRGDETDSWWYTLTTQEATYSFNYEVEVFYKGEKVGSDWVMTRFGGALKARQLKARHIRRFW